MSFVARPTMDMIARLHLVVAYFYKGRKDFNKTLAHLRIAADRGNARAQNELGVMYNKGEGAQQNDTKAVEWYFKSANQGFDRAQANLGWAYYEGKGVPQSFVESEQWYRLAAEQGHAESQYNLGILYYHGYGTRQSNDEARYWIRKSANAGIVPARIFLEDHKC